PGLHHRLASPAWTYTATARLASVAPVSVALLARATVAVGPAHDGCGRRVRGAVRPAGSAAGFLPQLGGRAAFRDADNVFACQADALQCGSTDHDDGRGPTGRRGPRSRAQRRECR